MAAASLKKRASSLSALEYQDLSDNRSESSQGAAPASPNGDSRMTDKSLDGVEEEEEESDPTKRQVQFDDIDNDLFFKDRTTMYGGNENDVVVRDGGTNAAGKESTKKDKKRSSSSKLSPPDEKSRRSRSTSRTRNGGSMLGSKFSRIRESVATLKRNRYETKDTVGGPEHPDEIRNTRWPCTVL